MHTVCHCIHLCEHECIKHTSVHARIHICINFSRRAALGSTNQIHQSWIPSPLYTLIIHISRGFSSFYPHKSHLFRQSSRISELQLDANESRESTAKLSARHERRSGLSWGEVVGSPIRHFRQIGIWQLDWCRCCRSAAKCEESPGSGIAWVGDWLVTRMGLSIRTLYPCLPRCLPLDAHLSHWLCGWLFVWMSLGTSDHRSIGLYVNLVMIGLCVFVFLCTSTAHASIHHSTNPSI